MKIAFLTSYNSDLFRKNIERFLSGKNYALSFWWNGYGVQEQSVFDPSSSLYSFDPDLVIIHLEIEWLLGDFSYDVLSLNESGRKTKLEEVKSKISSLINTLAGKLPNTRIVIENFMPRNKSMLGTLDSNINFGLGEITTELNTFLFSLRRQLRERLVIHDYAALISASGQENCFDNRLYRLAKNPFASSFYEKLFQHYYSIIDTQSSPRKKCVVVDLDNTLWGGIVGQDGIENLELGGTGLGEAYVHFQKALLNLYRKGIFLAVCSKNNFNDAIEVIDKHPDMILRKENFSSLKINWLDKTVNIKSIAGDLNIGTDSIVFLDDNPAECELVRQQMPEVEVINLSGDPDNYIKQLLAVDSLNTVFLTKEDLFRNQMHLADVKRKDLEQNYSNLDEYYKSLDMQAHIYINDQSQISRVAQLTQKTNQFNLTTRRYTAEEIKNFMTGGGHSVYTLRLVDKFGDNGIVLVAIVRLGNKEWAIDTLLMSCRVIGRQAETALLNVILEDAQKEKIQKVNGEFIETKKNAPAEDFFKRHGFNNDSDTVWHVALPAKLNQHFINIILE